MVKCIPMLVTFRNPQGRINQADLTEEQVLALNKLPGYERLS